MTTVLVMVWVLSGCGHDDVLRQKRIDTPRRPDTVSAAVGSIRLVAMRIVAPGDGVHVKGEDAGLFLTLVNNGSASDALTSVRAVAAESVELRVGATAGKEDIDVEMPPGGVVSLQRPGGPHLELINLRRDIGRGTFLPVTFHFRKAGVVRVKVFVQAFSHAIVSPQSGS